MSGRMLHLELLVLPSDIQRSPYTELLNSLTIPPSASTATTPPALPVTAPWLNVQRIELVVGKCLSLDPDLSGAVTWNLDQKDFVCELSNSDRSETITWLNLVVWDLRYWGGTRALDRSRSDSRARRNAWYWIGPGGEPER